MIDVWLIFAMFVPFIEVLLHTYMETLRTRDEDKEETKSVNTMGSQISVSDIMKQFHDTNKRLPVR